MRTPAAAIAVLLWCAAATAQDEKPNAQAIYIHAHYTKYDFRIPMRDGAKLFTSVYVPKDRGTPYPILMLRTPYSIEPYGIDNYPKKLGPADSFAQEGFIFAYQDVRGRYLSEGTFTEVPPHKLRLTGPRDTDESTDTYDTIDWLIKNVPDNNGKVGIWGVSYAGFFAAFSLIDSHPALAAVSPQAPMADVGNGDDIYHNGVFYLAANFGFYTSFKPRAGEPARRRPSEAFDYGTPDQYDFYLRMGPLISGNRYLQHANPFWEEALKHTRYDEYWRSRALPQYMHGVKPATLVVGGWFDAEDLGGTPKLFRAIDQNNPLAPDTLVMGPWSHGGWSRDNGDRLGYLRFGSKTGEYFRDQIELPFFVRNLKGKGDGLKSADGRMPKALVFETGANQWQRFDVWPPRSAVTRELYLDAGGKLSFERPEQAAYDEYLSDPSKPVPVTPEIGPGMPGDYMTRDQRFASQRPDVLVYQTEPLVRDISVAGPPVASLSVSTSGTDSDFVVKLIDVYPSDYPNPEPNPANIKMGGYQQLVRGEPFRGKFRNSLDKH